MSDNYLNCPSSDAEWASLPASEDMMSEFMGDCLLSGKLSPFSKSFTRNSPSSRHERAHASDGTLGNNSDRPPNAKVAIARLKLPSIKCNGGRVSQACENCHAQKAKCSGQRPTCHRCQDMAISCNYGDRKREKTLRQLRDLRCQVQIYQGLLRELYPRLDIISAKKVDQTLRELSMCSPQPAPAAKQPDPYHQQFFSLDAKEFSEENFGDDKELQAMGFIGEHSEIRWLYNLQQSLEKDHETPCFPQNNSGQSTIASMNYCQDESRITIFDYENTLELPSRSTADQLVRCYFQIVHPSFPVIGKAIFLAQYRTFYSNPSARPGDRWLAVLNLVFAIAARHSLFVNDRAQRDNYQHLRYFSRAWWLGMSNGGLLDHPNLQQVQIEGLAAFYLLSIGQTNRSWRICTFAMRSSLSLGLHLRSECDDIAPSSKEIQYRIWWALYMLDNFLYVMTGRPPCTGKVSYTTPLPVPYEEGKFQDENVVSLITNQQTRESFITSLLLQENWNTPRENLNHLRPLARLAPENTDRAEESAFTHIETLSPNESLRFLYMLDLAFIMREAVDTLYTQKASHKSWADIDFAIATLISNTESWYNRLPTSYQFKLMDPVEAARCQCLSLAFYFYSTRLIITKPCVGRRAQQATGTLGAHGDVCEIMATLCVETAVKILDLFPDDPDPAWIYGISPSWCALHYIMQSTTILLMELFSRCQSGASHITDIEKSVQKAARWIRTMSTEDPCSERAWLVCKNILSRYQVKLGLDVEFGKQDLRFV